MATGLPLVKKCFDSIRINSIISSKDATIQKKIYGSGTTALIISNEEMEDIMNIVKSLQESGLPKKVISETIKSGANEQKADFWKHY